MEDLGNIRISSLSQLPLSLIILFLSCLKKVTVGVLSEKFMFQEEVNFPCVPFRSLLIICIPKIGILFPLCRRPDTLSNLVEMAHTARDVRIFLMEGEVGEKNERYRGKLNLMKFLPCRER